MANNNVFPYETSKDRLADYNYYERLFLGDHFTAFNIKINNKDFNTAYSKMRYVKANFAGLISKIVADMLFSEPISVKVEEGDQEWLDGFIHENRLDVMLYESALTNSYLGDALFKLRIGKRMAGDTDNSIIMSNCPATIYFPNINPMNIDEDPEQKELAWTVEVVGEDGKVKKYLRKEIHYPGRIENKIFLLENDVIKGETTFEGAGFPGVLPVQETKIDKQLIIHFPNWKTATRYWGLSDYYDLDSLFYAINNRLSKIDNILDKHSDPLLLVPPGILDEKGRVKKGNLGVVEIKNAEDGKPEYVVWDASLANAFSEVDKLVEMLMMVSETSPDALGMGKGMSDSGRALKLKLLRTLAKTARKKLYYNHAIKEMLYRAQMLGKAWGIKFNGKELEGEPVMPEIVWADGLPVDETEQVDNLTKRLDNGTISTKEAIMRMDSVDEDEAETMEQDIKDEKKVDLPKTDYVGGNAFGKKPDTQDPMAVITDTKNKAMMGGK